MVLRLLIAYLIHSQCFYLLIEAILISNVINFLNFFISIVNLIQRPPEDFLEINFSIGGGLIVGVLENRRLLDGSSLSSQMINNA